MTKDGLRLAELLVTLKRELGVLALRGNEEGEAALVLQEVEIEVEVSAYSSADSLDEPVLRIVDSEPASRQAQRVKIKLKPLGPLDLGS